MFYLVRDAARPFHPVMGIASLENSPIFIGARDDLLGWTVESFVAALNQEIAEAETTRHAGAGEVRAAFERLLRYSSGIVAKSSRINFAPLPKWPTQRRRWCVALPIWPVNLPVNVKMRCAMGSVREQSTDGIDSHELKRSSFGNISEDAYELLFLKNARRSWRGCWAPGWTIEQFLAQPDVADTGKLVHE